MVPLYSLHKIQISAFYQHIQIFQRIILKCQTPYLPPTHCSKPPFFVQKFNFRKTLNLIFEHNLTEYFGSKMEKKFNNFQFSSRNWSKLAFFNILNMKIETFQTFQILKIKNRDISLIQTFKEVFFLSFRLNFCTKIRLLTYCAYPSNKIIEGH